MPLAIEIIKQSFYQENEITGNLAVVQNFRRSWGGLVNEVCSSSNGNLETYILESLYFIESRCNPNATNGATYGFGQIDPKTATNVPFWLKQRAKIMTPSQESKIFELFGQKLGDCLLNLKYDNSPSPCSGGKADSLNLITKEMLLKPEINIWISSMFIDYLIWKYSTGGSLISPPTAVRMDRVIVHYNAGGGNAAKVPTTLNAIDTTAWVSSKLSTITSTYILKFIGRNGMIDILTR